MTPDTDLTSGSPTSGSDAEGHALRPVRDHSTPFLKAARTWMYGDSPPAKCQTCAFDWSVSFSGARSILVEAPARYSSGVTGRSGEHGFRADPWVPAAYIWHLADLTALWAERLVEVECEPDRPIVGVDPDRLAAVRRYGERNKAGALFALERGVGSLVSVIDRLGPDHRLTHPRWGVGTVGQLTVWLAHEAWHHESDLLADVD